jgi:hypothetical protein
MYCKHCEPRSDAPSVRRRQTRRSRILKCERCGEPIVASVGGGSAGGSLNGTGAQLERFGLANPLLELKREGT